VLPGANDVAAASGSRQDARRQKLPDPMNATPESDPAGRKTGSRRARLELLVAGAALAFGLLVLPGLIYVVGGALMGPYGENRGLGSFYGDFLRDLVEPSGRAWALALGPLVLLTAVRAVFIGVRGPSRPVSSDKEEYEAPRTRRDEAQRVEPRVTLD
jgi:hypothetical protein